MMGEITEDSLMVAGNSQRPTRELTVKEYATLERVTERTVWNWIDKSAIQTRRTPGGGVRVLVTENR